MNQAWQQRAEQLDREDSLRGCRDQFQLNDGEIYLEGDSLGALPRQVEHALTETLSHEWGKRQIRSWNESWIDLPQRTARKIAPIIGANSQIVICADSVSVNLFKLMAACLMA